MSNNSNLAKFAFNIYGTLSSLDHSPPSSSSSAKSKFIKSNKLIYNCEREVSCLTDFEVNGEGASHHHIIIGGKNYLKLLMVNDDQSNVLNEVNILDPVPTSRVSGNKIHNFNTIQSNGNLLATGMVDGTINMYQIQNNGKSRLIRKFNDHKRRVNSLDFYDPADPSFSNLLISGAQDGCVKLWDLRQASIKPAMTILPKSNHDSVRSCQFSYHSRKLTILSVHDSGTLNKYDVRSLSSNNSMSERKWTFHTGPCLSLNVHPELEYVVTCGRDQKVCMWNYGENNSSYNMNNTPDQIIQTYGPVSKVRWCPYSSDNDSNALYNYDFACMYLNEDPTITVYNLKRKYVPKEIVQSNRSYMNFIWGHNSSHLRKIWAITKNNQFIASNLDHDDNVSRPSESLNAVSVAWGNGIGDVSFISQNKSDFDTVPEPVSIDDEWDEEKYNKVTIGSSSHNSLSYSTSPIESPVSMPGLGTSVPGRPALIRSSTGLKKSPSPSPQIRNSLSFHEHSPLSNSLNQSPLNQSSFNQSSINQLGLSAPRPPLNRGSSQNTIDSVTSFGSPISEKKQFVVNHASPYIVPLSLPLPLNDEIVFETLSNNYLVTIPDGFSLVDVCLLNASVAGSVNRFRDCQIWRILAVGLEQYQDSHISDPTDNIKESVVDTDVDEMEDEDSKIDKENKSISSELGNFVGSFTSNSTSTTNYGDSAASEVSDRKSKSSYEVKSSSTNNLMDMINHRNSFANNISISPNISRSNSMVMGRMTLKQEDDNEHAVIDDEDEEERNQDGNSENVDNIGNRGEKIGSEFSKTGAAKTQDKLNDKNENKLKHHSSVPVLIPSKAEEIKLRKSPKNMAILNRMKTSRGNSLINESTKDLDNENLNILNNASFSCSMDRKNSNSLNSSNFGSSNFSASNFGSLKSRRSSSIVPTYGFLNSKNIYGNGLEEVDELSSEKFEDHGREHDKELESGLTKAIEENKHQEMGIPWKINNLIEKAINHAAQQGDIILCSSLSLLFYAFAKPLNLKFFQKDKILEWLSLYIEILHKKGLFVNATNILNISPIDLREKLIPLFNADTLRLYCDNCHELITNEDSKRGFWYCEKCSRKQKNCVYCNEPCKGLNVVISLKCGHRGHFGCLKEWFIEDENIDCPGGCNEVLF